VGGWVEGFSSTLMTGSDIGSRRGMMGGMPRTIATNTAVDHNALLDFLRPRHQMILLTHRRDGSPQLSPVTGGVDDAGRIVIASYPERAKVANLRRTAECAVLVLSDDFGGAWVQVDGTAEVLDMPEALDGLVDYYRCISGEHPDWEDYRAAMARQDKSLIRITVERWGPIATGGFPPGLTT
jgi:PPOX class probable F420-dependent enzyme